MQDIFEGISLQTVMKALKCTTLGGISQRRIRCNVDPCARATYHESVRYGMGTCTRYAIHVL